MRPCDRTTLAESFFVASLLHQTPFLPPNDLRSHNVVVDRPDVDDDDDEDVDADGPGRDIMTCVSSNICMYICTSFYDDDGMCAARICMNYDYNHASNPHGADFFFTCVSRMSPSSVASANSKNNF
mmetsp:Transcript_16753/g.46928  ORF Transcript_16753/g.46928 Transcript_16753/m.46928 type:complete len:126 (-) Transcript_16753:373-750(-)